MKNKVKSDLHFASTSKNQPKRKNPFDEAYMKKIASVGSQNNEKKRRKRKKIKKTVNLDDDWGSYDSPKIQADHKGKRVIFEDRLMRAVAEDMKKKNKKVDADEKEKKKNKKKKKKNNKNKKVDADDDWDDDYDFGLKLNCRKEKRKSADSNLEGKEECDDMELQKKDKKKRKLSPDGIVKAVRRLMT